MNKCPVCSTEIEDSFGLLECPGCKKILFADFDGTLKVHEEGSVVKHLDPEPINVETFDVGSEVPQAPEPSLQGEQPSESWGGPSLDDLDPVSEPEVLVTPTLELQPEKLATAEAFVNEQSSDETQDSNLDMVEEINQFANSENSSLKQGAFIYSLKINNIDTEDIKDEILEVLRDRRLNIDIANLKFSLPTLELKDLNPIKVSIIVSKIKHLPVDMEWVQRSELTGEESEL